MKKLNLDNLNINETKKINEISYTLISKINETLSKIEEENDIEFNVNNDILNSKNNILESISIIEFAKIENKINQTIFFTSNYILFKLLKENNLNTSLNGYILLIKFKLSLKNIIIKFKNISYSIIYSFIAILIYSKNYKKRKDKFYTFLDTFFLKSSFEKNVYHDRWYNNYRINNFIYLPTILLNPFNYFFISIKKSKNKNFFLKEFVITPKDTLKILFEYFKLSIATPNINFKICNTNYDSVLQYSIKNSRFNISILRALQNKYFILNLKKNNIKFNLIEWNENQNIDKSINYYNYKYSPENKIIGIRRFFQSDQLLSLYSTNYQIKNNFLPKKFLTSNEFMVKNFIPDNINMELKIIPYNRVNENHFLNGKKSNTLLVILPIDFKISKKMIDLIDEINISKKNIFLKPHPNNEKKISSLIKNKYQILTSIKNYDDYKFIFTTSSSFVIEAINFKKEIIYFYEKSKLEYCPLNTELINNYLIKISNSLELNNVINKKKITQKNLNEINSIFSNYEFNLDEEV